MSLKTNKTGNPGIFSKTLLIIGGVGTSLGTVLTLLSICIGIKTCTTDSSRLTVMSDTISVDKVGEKTHISFLVTITNKGKTNLNIDSPVMVKLWLIPMTALTNNCVFDWEKYMNKNIKSFACQTLNASYQGEYASGESVTNSFDFFVDTGDFKKYRYTVMARADAKFKTDRFLDFLPGIPNYDYKYDVHIFRNVTDSLKHPLKKGK